MNIYQDETRCPKCHGAMFDNRLTKRNPKAPDFKCKDRSCDGVVWPPKNGVPQPTSKPVATERGDKSPYSVGGPIPGIDGTPALDRLFALYGVCLAEAIQQAQKLDRADFGSSPETITSMAATMFIAASKI